MTKGALALAEVPEPAPRPQLVPAQTGDLDLEALQNAIVDAMSAAKGLQTAADKFSDAELSATDDALNVQTTVSAALMPMLINADAQAIIKATMAKHNVKLRLNLIPGAPSKSAPVKAKRAAASGSVQALAEQHPVVQQAQKIFSAEIRNVIDLRDKD